MRRLAFIAFALLPLFAARANVYSVSNDVVTFTCTDRTLPVDIRYGFRFTVKAYQGATVIDLSNRVVRYKVFDLRDNQVVQETEAQVDSTNDTATASLLLTGLQPGQYEGKMLSYNTNDVLVATLSCDRLAAFIEADSIAWTNTLLTVTNLGASGGGGGSTSVTVTNLIVSTNLISVTVTNTGGGGGGSGTLSGFNSATTGGVFLVVSNGWDASITNEGNVFTIYTGLPKGSTGVNQVATWNGTNWIATALGAPTPTPSVGTNVQKFATVWGVTNTFVAPSTQVMFTAWGAGGGNTASGAGHARALWVGAVGTIFDIVVGTAGGASQTNNGPFSGAGINPSGTNFSNGGGATYIAISGTTNYILMAGGSGGGSGATTGIGGPGGGFYFGTLDGTLVTGATNVLAGQGASASNEYGLAAIGGSNAVASLTNQMHVGGFLYGGHASTNGCTAGVLSQALGGGGGGWFGGGGATRTNATAGASLGAGGGGGLSYANTNYVIFAQLIAGERANTGVPAAQDHPTYTAGRGVGGANSAAGANGCAGAMW